MSRRKCIVLIALTGAAAVILGVLPWAWPAYRHLIGTRIYEDYELRLSGFAVGFWAGLLAGDVLSRRRRKQP